VKNLLIGLAPTDMDVATVRATGAVGLQQLIVDWTTGSTTQPFFQAKMISFFRNVFQQTGFTPTVDFQNQLLQNGGFDFGPLGTGAVGGDAFALLVQNLQDMFARTAWQLVVEGNPFTDVLTTTRFQMTTGLKSLYLQIEMPNDQPYAFSNTNKLNWTLDYSGNAIPLEDSLNPNSTNYMVFDDEPAPNGGTFYLSPTCRGGTTKDANGNLVLTAPFGGAFNPKSPTGGYAQLFQRLLGYTPRWPFLGQPTCWEHPSKPYFTDQDMSDWEWVTISPMSGSTYSIKSFDLPTLRQTNALSLALPRIGFFTTPAYLAIWNTNNSNDHRVTTNQTLLAALGESFTSESVIIPLSEMGLDSNHATTGTACYGCHKSLDPMRMFFASQFDFNDRNDFLTQTFTGNPANPRPGTVGGVFAFGDVNQMGANLTDLGTFLGQVTDGNPSQPLKQFAAAITQYLCFYANSTGCSASDPLFRQIASDFASNNYDFLGLIKEFFASTIVTGVPAAPDAGVVEPSIDGGASAPTTADGGVPPGEPPISISRRQHFCDALSNRLGITDVCQLAVPLPSQTQAATSTIAQSLADDTFSRGAQSPVTPSEPNLFFRAAVEELCENLAPQLVDAKTGTSVYSSSNVTSALDQMVQTIMGYPPSDPHYTLALQILTTHQQTAQGKSNASTALQSTFVLACESPTSVGIGL
jgi:hypothetical protein